MRTLSSRVATMLALLLLLGLPPASGAGGQPTTSTTAGAAKSTKVSDAQCYFLNGAPSLNSYRCDNSTAGHSTCCQAGAVCYSNGVCKVMNEGIQDWQRVGCTDPTWKDPACLDQCQKYAPGSSAGIRPCDGIENGTHYCCDPGPYVGSFACCSTTSDIFLLGTSVPSVLATIPLSPATNTGTGGGGKRESTTSSATATSSTPTDAGATTTTTSSSFSTTASSPGGNNTSTSSLGIGLGVGLGVGIPLAAAIAGAFWFFGTRSRPRADGAGAGAEGFDGASSAHHHHHPGSGSYGDGDFSSAALSGSGASYTPSGYHQVPPAHGWSPGMGPAAGPGHDAYGMPKYGGGVQQQQQQDASRYSMPPTELSGISLVAELPANVPGGGEREGEQKGARESSAYGPG